MACISAGAQRDKLAMVRCLTIPCWRNTTPRGQQISRTHTWQAPQFCVTRTSITSGAFHRWVSRNTPFLGITKVPPAVSGGLWSDIGQVLWDLW